MDPALRPRLAQASDLPVLRELMDLAIKDLQRPFLSEAQIVASGMFMGLDSQLIEDRTYFLVEAGGRLAGCGGWSRRATLYGADHSPGRNAAILDPAVDAARIRAMFTHPDFARRGVGRLILGLCEAAAAKAGFRRAELVATLAGQPLYAACGYQALEHLTDDRGGTPVPLIRMGKAL